MPAVVEAVPPQSPEDFPQTPPPRDLHRTTDIRFVITEIATLTERVGTMQRTLAQLPELIEKALDRHSSDLKERIIELKSDFKETDGKVAEIEKKVAFVKGAMFVLGGIFTLSLVIVGVVAAKLLE